MPRAGERESESHGISIRVVDPNMMFSLIARLDSLVRNGDA